jgi:hypothetical protein
MLQPESRRGRERRLQEGTDRLSKYLPMYVGHCNYRSLRGTTPVISPVGLQGGGEARRKWYDFDVSFGWVGVASGPDPDPASREDQPTGGGGEDGLGIIWVLTTYQGTGQWLYRQLVVLVVVDEQTFDVSMGRPKRLRGDCLGPGAVSMPGPPSRRLPDTDGFFGFGVSHPSCSMLRKVNSPFVCCAPTPRPAQQPSCHSGNMHVSSGMDLEISCLKGRGSDEGQTPTVGSNPCSDSLTDNTWHA